MDDMEYLQLSGGGIEPSSVPQSFLGNPDRQPSGGSVNRNGAQFVVQPLYDARGRLVGNRGKFVIDADATIRRAVQFTEQQAAVGNSLWSGGLAYKFHSPDCPIGRGGSGQGVDCWIYGCVPFPGFRVSMPRLQRDAATLGVGAEVRITVGDSWGSRDIREAVVGPGAPLVCAGGDYQSVSVEVLAMAAVTGNTSAPLGLTWIDGDITTTTPGGASSLWRSRIHALTNGAGFVAVPDGAVEVMVEQSVTVSWRTPGTTSSAGTDISITPAAGDIIRVQGHQISVSGDTNVMYFVQPL